MSPQAKPLVVYMRVSTTAQGRSQLGIEAQRAAVRAYAAAGGHSIVAEHVEVESGGKSNRPELAAALAACRLRRATLCIAKLDRLSRSVAFTSAMMEAGVEFVACDMPHANRLTIHIMAAMAEHERTAGSERTRAALAAAKARGVRLGNPRGAAHLLPGCGAAAAASVAARKAAAGERARALTPVLAKLAAEGHSTPRARAAELTRRGIPAPGGGAWYAQQVRRMEGVGAAPLPS